MHFAILGTEDLIDAYGTTYTSYKLYCNGTYHGSARYREFADLHNGLRNHFNGSLPSFPPKKMFNLSALEVNARRAQLEKYMQNLGQLPEAVYSAPLQDFLKKLILRSAHDLDASDLQVFLLNGSAISLQLDPKTSADEVLEAVCRDIKLPLELTNYFALYLAREDLPAKYIPFKKFAPFEYPFACLHLNSPPNGLSRPKLRIILKKSYWDAEFDTEILDSPSRVGINLLFVETVDAINRGWIVPTSEQKAQLEHLQSKGSRREFVQLARNIKGYGSVHFGPAVVDYPSPGTRTVPYLTGKDFVCPVNVGGKQEAVFRIVRMRCWRLCLSETFRSGGPAERSPDTASLMFEYLMAREQLQWVTVVSEEAVWMSACLQSMVEELMMKKSGKRIEKWEKKVRNGGETNGRTESLSVSVTVTRNVRSDNVAFEGIGNDDL